MQLAFDAGRPARRAARGAAAAGARRRGGRAPLRAAARRRTDSHARSSATSSRETRASRGAGPSIALASAPDDPLLEEAELVVFDLETTGLSARSSRICEIGAVRVRALELGETFETLVRTGVPLPAPIRAITGIRDEELRRAPRDRRDDPRLPRLRRRRDARRAQRALRRLLPRPAARTADGTAARRAGTGHGGARAAACSTGRVARVGLASLAHFYGTAAEPCHRALPDAQATAEILVRLIGEAQERGARTLVRPPRARGAARAPRLRQALARPRGARSPRRLPVPRPARAGAVRRPGARPARAAAVVLPLRPPAAGGRGGARGRRADRVARARQRARGGARGAAADPRAAAAGERAERPARPLRVPAPTRRPVRRRRRRPASSARSAAAAGPSGRRGRSTARPSRSSRSSSAAGRCPACGAGSPTWPTCLRYEDAARLRDRISALEAVIGQLQRLEALRAGASLPRRARRASPAGGARSSSPAAACAAVRTLPPGGGARLEVEAGVADALAALAGRPSYRAGGRRRPARRPRVPTPAAARAACPAARRDGDLRPARGGRLARASPQPAREDGRGGGRIRCGRNRRDGGPHGGRRGVPPPPTPIPIPSASASATVPADDGGECPSSLASAGPVEHRRRRGRFRRQDARRCLELSAQDQLDIARARALVRVVPNTGEKRPASSCGTRAERRADRESGSDPVRSSCSTTPSA